MKGMGPLWSALMNDWEDLEKASHSTQDQALPPIVAKIATTNRDDVADRVIKWVCTHMMEWLKQEVEAQFLEQ
jgi:hypothetical protein